jgi:hypothetical protein
MLHPLAIMVVTISFHFAPYSMDLQFFCLTLNGDGQATAARREVGRTDVQ